MTTRKLKRVVIKEELYALTKDTFCAIILGQLIYWQERVEDFDIFIKEEKARADNNGIDLPIELQNGWMYKKASDFAAECMLNISDVTIRRYLQNLINQKYIECRNNPKYKWDKTLQYRVNLSFVISEIKKLGYDGLSGYTSLNIQSENTELQNEGSSKQNEAAIPKITNIDYNIDKEERDKSLSKKDAKDELFEECWKAYQRKGSKAKSKPYWDKLTEGEKALVKLHIPAYVASVSEKKYIKDFERYLRDKCFNNVVYKGNAVLFDPEQMQNEGEYHPVLDGFNLMWVESEKCYMTPFDLDMLVDGYTKENRPASAMVMKNGIRYIWDKEVKQWKVKR